MLASYRVSWMLKESYSSCRSSTFRPLKTFRTGIALQGYLLMDGLEAPARPCEIDHPVRETNLPMPERTLSPMQPMPRP
ncbi:MAG: hypothetical protein DMG39_13860 [Acidobacteria bacterium]|nr:MAG: hypothetical protein DMG39_13860 [Acidobacteriota bacterium]